MTLTTTKIRKKKSSNIVTQAKVASILEALSSKIGEEAAVEALYKINALITENQENLKGEKLDELLQRFVLICLEDGGNNVEIAILRAKREVDEMTPKVEILTKGLSHGYAVRQPIHRDVSLEQLFTSQQLETYELYCQHYSPERGIAYLKSLLQE